MGDDRDDGEREQTTVVETGGGGGGGVLAVILLIIVVLVLLYVFRADLGLGSKSVMPGTVNVTANPTKKHRQKIGRVAVPRPTVGRGSYRSPARLIVRFRPS